MAEFGAHLTSTRSEEEAPSIFDVLAQESLVASLKPALSHILRVLAEKNPTKFGWLYGLGDELFTFLHLVLENYYLRRNAGSFAENFYGLKRELIVKSRGKGKHQKLPRSAHLKSLFFLVLVPYIKNKCDNSYEQLQQSTSQGEQNANQSWRSTLCRAFLGAYPLLHMLWEGTLFTYQLAYTLGKSRCHTPYLALAGLQLEYLQDGDMEQISEPLALRNNSCFQRVCVLGSKASSVLAVTLASTLSVGVFFLQFLEWWYASDQHSASLTALPTPTPPQIPVPDSVPKLHTLCMLCNRVRTNDTVLSTSGYVFCYPCIYNYVRQHGTCPATGYPALMEHLVKLYLPES